MRTLGKIISLIILSLSAVSAWSQTTSIRVDAPASSTSTSSADVEAPSGRSESSFKDVLQNKKFEDTHEITDIKLRAEQGSMSRYSLKFALSYFGPTVNEPFAKDQPNPENLVRSTETKMQGQFGGRYRLDSESALTLGTGLAAIYPFHGVKRFDASTPYFGYDTYHRVNDFQLRSFTSVGLVTDPVRQATAEEGFFNFGFSFIHDLGLTGFSGGLDTSLSHSIYSRDYVKSDKTALQYRIMLSPVVKYNFSDRLNITSNLFVPFSNPRSARNESVIRPLLFQQNLGIGYAFTRDIYIQPSVNFYPRNFDTDTTTINISSIFSLM